ncbi:hypothetical protein TL16_g04827 [Triparma laevis f. inornata]|uniref:Rad4/PNGase transglutaminase-like fold domain-containing protein n=1 Tax=Triparma laevis f. inornata TaxID=1714386 RepID=A0A9W7E4M4_9STRA|nr:hypothetical protein TL16_g04827 [Triparma laevis f. inornata]
MSSKHNPPPNEDPTTTTSKRPLVQASDSEDSDDSVNWESDNDDDVGAPSADEEENRFSDLQNNAARDLTFKLNPNNSPPVEEKKKAKKKRRKSTTKTRCTLATLARKFPSLIKDSRNLHCSVVLGTVASGMFFSGVASSNEFRARVMSCFPLGEMVLALDSACFERYDDSRKIGSRQDLQFLFDWFCEACCLNNERTKGKSGKKQKKGRYSNIASSAWSGLFTNLVGESSDAEIATLFASFLRMCDVRTRLVMNIPTPLADDVEIFSRKESAGRVMSFGLEIVRMLTGGGKAKTKNTTYGGSSTDPIELSDGVGAMPGSVEEIREKNEAFRNPAFFFVEALCEEERKWVSLDPCRNLFDHPEGLEQGLKKFWSDHPRKVNILKEARGCVSYVVGVEGGGDTEPLTVADVTRRYAASYTTTQTLRVGDGDHWFSNFVKGLCGGGVVDLTDEGEEDKFGAGVENLEKVELEARVVGEKPPKSKEGE